MVHPWVPASPPRLARTHPQRHGVPQGGEIWHPTSTPASGDNHGTWHGPGEAEWIQAVAFPRPRLPRVKALPVPPEPSVTHASPPPRWHRARAPASPSSFQTPPGGCPGRGARHRPRTQVAMRPLRPGRVVGQRDETQHPPLAWEGPQHPKYYLQTPPPTPERIPRWAPWGAGGVPSLGNTQGRSQRPHRPRTGSPGGS